MSGVKASRMFVKSFINGLKLIEIRQNHGSGRGHGSPLQYSCLEDPRNSGAWRATVRGVAKNQTGLRTAQHSAQNLRFLACEGTSSGRPAGGAAQPWPCTPAEQGTSPGRACPISCRELVVYSFAPSGLSSAQSR